MPIPLPGTTVLLLRAGKFAERWEEICRAFGVTVVPLSAPFGDTVPAAAFAEALRRHPEARAVLMQHSESSTGVLHDVRGIAAATRDSQAILIVDAVSSLGIADLQMDAWGVDVVVRSRRAHAAPGRPSAVSRRRGDLS